jgi:hypothetical protein
MMELDADTGISIAPPFISEKNACIREWCENPANEPQPVLHKEYTTSRGTLRQVVRKTHDYPDKAGLFCDHNVPGSRSIRYLVESEQDLDALECILTNPVQDELAQFNENAARCKKFCRDNGIFLSGYLSGVGDPMIWLSGVERIVCAALADPGFLERYVEVVSRWDMQQMELMLEAGVDMIVRRGWYESTDFWSPDLYRQFLFNSFRKEIEAAHQANVLVTYAMNSGTMALLDMFHELGFDILSNVDPLTPGTDLRIIKQKSGPKLTLTGGVNNNLVVEQGTVDEVRGAVIEAVETLAPGGGFILGPADSIGYITTNDTTIRNFYAMIDAWKEVRDYGKQS